MWLSRRWSPTMQRSMASACSCIHISNSPASALSISNLSHHDLPHCPSYHVKSYSTTEKYSKGVHAPNTGQTGFGYPQLVCQLRSGRVRVDTEQVDTSRMDRSAPYSVLSNLSCLRRKSLLGMASREHSVKRSFAVDGTVSGASHRGDTADGVSSGLTWGSWRYATTRRSCVK